MSILCKAESQSGHASYMVSIVAVKPEMTATHSSEDIIFAYIHQQQDVVHCGYRITFSQSDDVVGFESVSDNCDFHIWSKARYYVVGDRLTVIIVSSNGLEPMADVNRFLDSLHMSP